MNEAYDDIELQTVLSQLSIFKELGFLIDMTKLNFLKCLQNSINRGSCEHGSPSDLQMLFSDKNAPVLEILVANELSSDELVELQESPSWE
jgi:hypothetical protein